MALRTDTGAPVSDIPDNLPARLRRPCVRLTPEWDQHNRRLQAYQAFARYITDLRAWCDDQPVRVDAAELAERLGNTLPAFYALADDLPATHLEVVK